MALMNVTHSLKSFHWITLSELAPNYLCTTDIDFRIPGYQKIMISTDSKCSKHKIFNISGHQNRWGSKQQLRDRMINKQPDRWGNLFRDIYEPARKGT